MNYINWIFRNKLVRAYSIILLILSIGTPLYDTYRMGTFSPYSLIFSGVFIIYLIASFVEWKQKN